MFVAHNQYLNLLFRHLVPSFPGLSASCVGSSPIHPRSECIVKSETRLQEMIRLLEAVLLDLSDVLAKSRCKVAITLHVSSYPEPTVDTWPPV